MFPESSIAKIQDSKVYLKPSSVQVAKNGIFILVEGHLVLIDHLQLDEDGIYFNLTECSCCPVCGFPLVFGFCVNPDCPGKR